MILVYGNINISINMQVSSPIEAGKANTAEQNSTIDIAGHAPLKAISAARCGAKVALISTIGEDLLGKYCLNLLRKDGVQTSRIIKVDTQTGVSISLSDNTKITTATYDNIKEIYSDNHINERSLVMLSGSEHNNDHMVNLLKKVKDKNAKSMICISSDNPVSPETLELVDIVVVDESVKNSHPQIEELSDIYLISTKDFGASGSSANDKRGESHSSEDIDLNDSITDINGCFEVFCGFIAACIQSGLPLNRALTLASKAAHHAGQTDGAYAAIPHLGYLEDIIPKGDLKSQSY